MTDDETSLSSENDSETSTTGYRRRLVRQCPGTPRLSFSPDEKHGKVTQLPIFSLFADNVGCRISNIVEIQMDELLL